MKGSKYEYKDLREKLGKTQKEMGKMLGITDVAYCYKENGKRKFKPCEILLICKKANINPLDVMIK